MKKLVSVLLALVLGLGVFAVGASAAIVNPSNINQLITLMGGDPYVSDWEQTLPEFYGGAKFQGGHLVVGINVNADDRHTPLYYAVREFIAERDILVEYMQYSSNEFAAIMDYMNAHLLADERPEIFEYLVSYGLGFGLITVRFYEGHQEDYTMDDLITMFRETISDADMFAFEWSGAFGWPSLRIIQRDASTTLLYVVLFAAMVLGAASIVISVIVLVRGKKQPAT